ncbi:PASTA domain-containing protein [Saccharopolyspora erythraea]|uniref:PASTA domain-containing protein n=1 Tax=Saccharopolyspora erythraea TaxID=1836 RepID=UPI002013BDA0|nr:PASTA domain-containing protein [Saccharopolyspora erythraea]
MAGVSRELDYDGSPVVVPDVVGLAPADAIAAADAAGVPIVAAGPGDEPRPLRDDRGPVVRQRPPAGERLGAANWLVAWTEP